MENFELISLKIGAGADCKYRLLKTVNGVEMEETFHVECARPVDDYLRGLFEGPLQEIAAELLGVRDYNAFKPNGISFSGQSDKIGIVISGVIETPLGQAKFKTPKIKYKQRQNPIQEDAEIAALDIIQEAHDYLFDGKGAELEEF